MNDGRSRRRHTTIPEDQASSLAEQARELEINISAAARQGVASAVRPALAANDVRSLVTVAKVTSTMRGHAAEVLIDHGIAGLDQKSAINCDGLHTVPQTMLTRHVGAIDQEDLTRVCAAIHHAVGC